MIQVEPTGQRIPHPPIPDPGTATDADVAILLARYYTALNACNVQFPED